MTRILPMPVMAGSTTPTTKVNAQATAAQVETALEPLMPVSVMEVSMQLHLVDSQLGGSYLMNAQIHNDGSDISICSLDPETQDNLQPQSSERLNDKIYSAFKELFHHVNLDSIKEVFPETDAYNNTITWYIEVINLKYCVSLSYIHLEVSEVTHWAEMFQVASFSDNLQQPQESPQQQQQALQVTTTAPQCYVRQCWLICTVLLELPRGTALCILLFILGALQYTMLIFRFPSLCTLRLY